MPHTTFIDSPTTNAEREWFAFRVKPRHEKSVAIQLREKEEDCFLPLLSEIRNWAKRTAKVESPLIPGYVFCRSHRFGFLPVLTTPGVLGVVRAGNSPVPIPDAEISALERVINTSSVRVEACPYIEVGQKVEIRNGPLAGISGIVTELRKSKHMVLSVSLLRRSVLVHVDPVSVLQEGSQFASRQHQVA